MVLLASVASWGHVDDAHQFAMEAALEAVEEGFVVAESFWGGACDDGERVAVRHQLFKGHEYWFWFGVENDEAEIRLAIYDESGRRVDIEGKRGDYWAAARVNPPATDSYVILFSVGSAAGEEVHWALAYGYR